MLSFDITDRNIRIIKGTESNGKIKISAAATLNLEEAVIVNGHVNDINRVAMMINQVLKQNNMPDKEAIVSISSNQTVFKELLIPPNSKESEFMKSVRHELQMQINVDDSYSVAYVIVGEPEEDENGERMQKILATACPYDVVDCYKRIFHMLGISLKSVMIGCNCITKVLLADVKIKAKMPLLAVQIDANFISLNLYENNQLSFSRFASIDPEDYDDPDDYVYEAVNENIFRMLQFARSRGSEPIENVIFYGDTKEIPRLIDAMEEQEITVSQLNVPPQIHGYQNLEFSVYANAIGAMFKRNKNTEHINLLETDASSGNKGKAGAKTDSSSNVALVAGLVGALVLVGGAYGVLTFMDKSVVDETNGYVSKLESPDTAAKLLQYDDLTVKKDKVLAYADTIDKTSEAYKTQPVIAKEYYEAIDDALTTVHADLGFDAIEKEGKDGEDEEVIVEITSVDYENGVMTIPVRVETSDPYSQQYPAAMVKYLYDKYSDKFAEVTYTGYAVTSSVYTQDAAGGVDDEKTIQEVNFNLVLTLHGNEGAAVEETTEAEAAE